jgi:hypothetical protein
MKARRSRQSSQLREFCPSRRVLAFGILAMAFTMSCEPTRAAPEPRVSAEFGIFYGGQVQERQELPLEVDATRQVQGFRLRIDSPPERALEVRWELGMAGAGRPMVDSQGRRARPRKVQLGQARWRPGEAVFEQLLPFVPGDPLGLWNIRVQVGSQIVLDRPFFVFDEQERARQVRELTERDGGL